MGRHRAVAGKQWRKRVAGETPTPPEDSPLPADQPLVGWTSCPPSLQTANRSPSCRVDILSARFLTPNLLDNPHAMLIKVSMEKIGVLMESLGFLIMSVGNRNAGIVGFRFA
jgi:hypothetical protein